LPSRRAIPNRRAPGVAGARPLVDGGAGVGDDGGVIDSGYRGEILIVMTTWRCRPGLQAGEKSRKWFPSLF